MNYGRLAEHIYKRSVSRTINHYDGAALGADCATMPSGLFCAQASAFGRDDDVAKRALLAALNNAWAASHGQIDDMYVIFNIKVPERYREIKVRRMIEQAAPDTEKLNVPIACVDVSVLPCVSDAVAECVVCGRVKKNCQSTIHAGDDIVMTKWIGIEGTALMAAGSYNDLCKRYPSDMITAAQNFNEYLSVSKEASVIAEAATAVKSDACYMKAAREGGIFKALWELAADNGVGLVADLKSIPVKQETIEICEFFDLNPYELLSGGSLLAVTAHGADVVGLLADKGINAAVIGRICDGNDRVIKHDEETRFLEPAKSDEIFRYYEAAK